MTDKIDERCLGYAEETIKSTELVVSALASISADAEILSRRD